MHMMYTQFTKFLYPNRTREHVGFVQLMLMSAPVIPISPPFSQLFDVHGRGTIIPVCAVNFVWEAGVVKVTLEQGECLLWDGDIKGLLTQNKSWGFGECSGARFSISCDVGGAAGRTRTAQLTGFSASVTCHCPWLVCVALTALTLTKLAP